VIDHLLAADASSTSWISISKLINSFTTKHSESIIQQWWDTLSFLIVSYRDGYYINKTQLYLDKIHPSLIAYPKQWLELVGYKEIPKYIFPTESVKPITREGETLPPDLSSKKKNLSTLHLSNVTSQDDSIFLSLTRRMFSILIYPLLVIIGIYIGMYLQSYNSRRDYVTIGDHNE